MIETGRPIGRRIIAAETAALPAPLLSPTLCGSAAILRRTPAGECSGAGFASSKPVYHRSSGCCGRGRPRSRRGWVFQRVAGARRFLAAPSRSMFGRRICMIETGRKIGGRIDAAEDGRAPEAIVSSQSGHAVELRMRKQPFPTFDRQRRLTINRSHQWFCTC